MSFVRRNWQFILVGIFLLISIASIVAYGVNFGIDFKGGTLYQVELQKKVTPEEMLRIVNTIEQRIDPSGLKGNELSPVGNQFILIRTAQTGPAELEKIEARIRQQGKFEAMLDGNTVFTGDEIRKVLRGDTSYGVYRLGNNAFEWSMPFILNEKATKSFKEQTFHKCSPAGANPNGTVMYECEKTIFFLDRPNAVIITTQEQYSKDTDLLLSGNRFENIPIGTEIEELIVDSQLLVIVLDNNSLDMQKLNEAKKTTQLAILSPDVPKAIASDINAAGFSTQIAAINEETPWIWEAIGARQIISLTEGITNEDVADISQAKEFSTLNISGQRETLAEAREDLEELAILLESGSLPTPVKSISKETISPALGNTFFNSILLMGALALIIVAVVIIIRYRSIELAVPVFATIIAETVILVGILSLPFIRQPFDLAALAGLIAALGSGVNAEVVIVDELTSRVKRETLSLVQRIKSGLFIITTAALTVIGVMGPIVLFSRSMPGISSLYGFAIVAILGAIIGVIITRPAFTKVVEMIVKKKEEKAYQTHHEGHKQ